MPLLDLGAVTRTLTKVVDLSANASPAWPPLPAPKLNVVPLPPDKLAPDGTAGLYLYHLAEDAHFKNTPAPSGNDELRFTPMGLNLYYVLSARAEDTEAGTWKEQLIMGLAVKALRDHPIIDDGTVINGTQVLDPAIRNASNRLHIALQPIAAAEAVSYWTAGSAPLRLSAYYQVSVALLEPDEPPFLSRRVLRYGIQTFVSSAPRLDASQSTVTYQLPGEATTRTAAARPAQVTQVPPGDEIVLLGSGLTGGTATLLLRPGGAATPLEADASWGLQVTQSGASARTQLTASGAPLLPGIYAASIRVSRTITLPGGGRRVIAQTSNEVPVVIAPGISTIGPPTAAGEFTVVGTGFQPAAAVDVYADVRLTAATPPLTAGQFHVTDPTHVVFRLRAGVPPGTVVPLRIVVSGGECPPTWVTAP